MIPKNHGKNVMWVTVEWPINVSSKNESVFLIYCLTLHKQFVLVFTNMRHTQQTRKAIYDK